MKTPIFKVLQKVDSISQTRVQIVKEIKGSVKVTGVIYYSRTDTQATTTRHGSGDLQSTCGRGQGRVSEHGSERSHMPPCWQGRSEPLEKPYVLTVQPASSISLNWLAADKQEDILWRNCNNPGKGC